MHSPADVRYRPLELLRNEPEREAWAAWDSLTDRPVFLKTGPRAEILREISVLLALPRGVAPMVLDAIWDPDGFFSIVEEKLEGRTLLQAASFLAPDDIPALVACACSILSSLHRTGFVHADLKPANLFLVDGSCRNVRLVDLESALLPSVASPTADNDSFRATQPYAAPELLKGWTMDARADQYSFGITLRSLFPFLQQDDRWSAILDRMCREAPSQRFPDVTAVRSELITRFGLSRTLPDLPGFGCGPERGRAREAAELVDRVCETETPGPILVQARPGIGLTRFLLECVVSVARREGPPTRLLDLGFVADRSDALATGPPTRRIDEFLADGAFTIVGVPDPSPALCWSRADFAAWIRDFATRHKPWRMTLGPLGPDAFGDIVSASLGVGGPTADLLGVRLHDQTAGDLRVSADGFDLAVRGAGVNECLIWRLDSENLLATLEAWSSPSPPPRLSEVPADLLDPLGVVARIGSLFSPKVASTALAESGFPDAMERLLDAGLLVDDGSASLSFVHEILRRACRARALPGAGLLDRRLNDLHVPRPDRVVDVLEACARARQIGDNSREREFFRAAFEAAAREHRWDRIRDLFGYQRMAGDVWSIETAREQAERIGDLLTAAWPWRRVLLLVGRAMLHLGDAIGAKFIERVSEEVGQPEEAECLFLLSSLAQSSKRMPEYTRYMTALERLEALGCGLQPGVMDLERGRQALVRGERSEAERFGRQAAERLEKSGHFLAVDALMFLAVLSLPHRPAEARGILERALAATTRPLYRATVYNAISKVYEIEGDLDGFQRSAQAGVDALAGVRSERTSLSIRAQRAWAWVLLDRAREAEDEAVELLQFPALQREKPRRAFVLLLAGLAALHQGNGRSAIARMAAAWEMLGPGMEANRRAAVLRYLLDGLLDLGAWETVRDHGADLVLPEDEADLSVTLTATRAAALSAQAEGSAIEARNLLVAGREDAVRHTSRDETARYLHHLGMATLASAREMVTDGWGDATHEAAVAIEHFSAALDRFGTIGFGYYRARSLLGLSRAAALSGNRDRAVQEAEETIRLSRLVGARGVLADALHLRAELDLSAV